MALPITALLLRRTRDDRHGRVLYLVETTPVLPVPPKRYRDFEHLNHRLEAARLPAINLPGKLLLHSESALEARRAALEAGLRALVLGKTVLPAPLAAFLCVPDAAAAPVPAELVASTSSLASDYSEDDEEDAAARSALAAGIDVVALEVIQQRARVRERLANAKLLQNLLTASSVLSLVAFIFRRRLIDILSALAQSATAWLLIPFVVRNAEPPAKGFGMEDDPLQSSDSGDASKLYAWSLANSAASRSPPPKASETAPAASLTTVASEGSALSQPVAISQLDEHHDSQRYEDAWTLATQVMTPGVEKDGEVAWRVARACYYVTKGVPGNVEIIERSLSLCQRVLSLNEAQPQVHKWKAILHNAAGERGAVKDRILGAVAFETHTKRALELAPEDPTLFFLMGLFAFEVAKLSWIERTAARAIAGRDPPKATVADALKLFEEAMRLKPSAAFALEVGRCKWAMGDQDQARKTWQGIIDGRWPVESPEEKEAALAASDLLTNGM